MLASFDSSERQPADANGFARRVRPAGPPAVRSGRRAAGAGVRYGALSTDRGTNPDRRRRRLLTGRLATAPLLFPTTACWLIKAAEIRSRSPGMTAAAIARIRAGRRTILALCGYPRTGSVSLSTSRTPASGRPTSGSTTWPAVRPYDSRQSSRIRVRLCGRQMGAASCSARNVPMVEPRAFTRRRSAPEMKTCFCRNRRLCSPRGLVTGRPVDGIRQADPANLLGPVADAAGR